jgi:hypothetical protein
MKNYKLIMPMMLISVKVLKIQKLLCTSTSMTSMLFQPTNHQLPLPLLRPYRFHQLNRLFLTLLHIFNAKYSGHH